MVCGLDRSYLHSLLILSIGFTLEPVPKLKTAVWVPTISHWERDWRKVLPVVFPGWVITRKFIREFGTTFFQWVQCLMSVLISMGIWRSMNPLAWGQRAVICELVLRKNVENPIQWMEDSDQFLHVFECQILRKCSEALWSMATLKSRKRLQLMDIYCIRQQWLKLSHQTARVQINQWTSSATDERKVVSLM